MQDVSVSPTPAVVKPLPGPDTTPSNPENLALLLEASLEACGATQSIELQLHEQTPSAQETGDGDEGSPGAAVEPSNPHELHLALTDSVCPDPLLMMNHLGQTLAELSDCRPHRVSFSGGSRDRQSPSWIGFIDVDAFAATAQTSPKASNGEGSGLRSPQDYERFITEQSSWFSPAVKANPPLHRFAQVTQRQRIDDTAHLLAEVLVEQEELLDVLPVRYRRQTGSLIVTNQRLWCACESLSLRRLSAQDLVLFLGEIQQLELANNGLRIHEPGDHGVEHSIYFSTSESDNLEMLLSYFTPVVRREVIPETRPQRWNQGVGVGLVASLIIGIGWTAAGFTDFLMDQVPLEQAAVSADASSVSLEGAEPEGSQAAVEETATKSMAAALVAKQAGNQRCIDRFNGLVHPHGYVALNRTTKTLRISLERFAGDYVNSFEFDVMAEALANQVFSDCDRLSVDHVRVEDGRYSFLKGRLKGQKF